MQPLVRPLTPFTEGGSRSFASGGPESGGVEAMAKEEDVIEEETEESRRPRVARRPQMPTKAEYDSRMTLHADDRDWCPDCVAGGLQSPTLLVEEREDRQRVQPRLCLYDGRGCRGRHVPGFGGL